MGPSVLKLQSYPLSHDRKEVKMKRVKKIFLAVMPVSHMFKVLYVKRGMSKTRGAGQ